MTDRRITNDNLYLILPGKVGRVAAIYARDFKVSIAEALRHVYESAMYRDLEREESKLWHYGPVELYRMMLSE